MRSHVASVRPLRVFSAAVPCLATAVATFGACTSASQGNKNAASINGSVDGTTFQVASQLAEREPRLGPNCTPSSDGGVGCSAATEGELLSVALTNRSDATCSKVVGERNVEFANFNALQFTVATAQGNVTARTYAVRGGTAVEGTGAVGTFQTTDAACSLMHDEVATSGNVIVQQIDASHVSGTFSLNFGAKGSMSGAFDTEFCNPAEAGAPPPSSSEGGLVAPRCLP